MADSEITAVDPDCFLGGYTIAVETGDQADMSVVRHDVVTGGLTPVRGLEGLTAGQSVVVVDYEAPFDHEVGYFLYAGAAPPLPAEPIGEEIFPSSLFRATCGVETMYLRWLFDPLNQTQSFCLSPIGEVSYAPRVGVFPVIDRSDPVVVSDLQETARGTLRFVGRTNAEVVALRQILTKHTQPSLLSLPEHYMLGTNGQLYFQPLAVREEWINPDNRIPQHALTVDYVEISPPAFTSALIRTGLEFGDTGWIVWATDPPTTTSHGDALDRYISFQALLSSLKSFDEALYDTP